MALAGGHSEGFGSTGRVDAWWVGPMITALGLTLWGMYYAWAAWQAEHYYVGPYLSPFYGPLLFTDVTAVGSAPLEYAWFGGKPAWWPDQLPASPAFLIFLFPASFRATCYYYRKAYYRTFFGTPPGCAVGPAPTPGKYRGETGMLVVQNLHRYSLYFALILLPFLYIDAYHSFFYQGSFGVGVGSILLVVNCILLTSYTMGCHAWRHLIGGKMNCFSCGGIGSVAFSLYKPSSWFNGKHMQFAWMSLFWIMGADVYIRLVSMGTITDLNTWSGF
jgi:hypothetical protein